MGYVRKATRFQSSRYQESLWHSNVSLYMSLMQGTLQSGTTAVDPCEINSRRAIYQRHPDEGGGGQGEAIVQGASFRISVGQKILRQVRETDLDRKNPPTENPTVEPEKPPEKPPEKDVTQPEGSPKRPSTAPETAATPEPSVQPDGHTRTASMGASKKRGVAQSSTSPQRERSHRPKQESISSPTDPDFQRQMPSNAFLFNPKADPVPRRKPRPTYNRRSHDRRPDSQLKILQAKPQSGYTEEDDPQPDTTMLLQPETKPISHDQLVVEVKGIYAGLVMIEAKCYEVDAKQVQLLHASNPQPLSVDQWNSLILLHKQLLHEHHDFFLASQHPSASKNLSCLAEKYAMPARMWRHGIHEFLEILRRRLDNSLEFMLNFICIAYSMMALLYETVPAFEDTWVECLGDLARYRMAIEKKDPRDRETWSGVAWYWYHRTSDRKPEVGRLYHHLAILAPPLSFHQHSLYVRSLVCIEPFEKTQGSILTLLKRVFDSGHPVLLSRDRPFPRPGSQDHDDLTDFQIAGIRAHGILFCWKIEAKKLSGQIEGLQKRCAEEFKRDLIQFVKPGYADQARLESDMRAVEAQSNHDLKAHFELIERACSELRRTSNELLHIPSPADRRSRLFAFIRSHRKEAKEDHLHTLESLPDNDFNMLYDRASKPHTDLSKAEAVRHLKKESADKSIDSLVAYVRETYRDQQGLQYKLRQIEESVERSFKRGLTNIVKQSTIEVFIQARFEPILKPNTLLRENIETFSSEIIRDAVTNLPTDVQNMMDQQVPQLVSAAGADFNVPIKRHSRRGHDQSPNQHKAKRALAYYAISNICALMQYGFADGDQPLSIFKRVFDTRNYQRSERRERLNMMEEKEESNPPNQAIKSEHIATAAAAANAGPKISIGPKKPEYLDSPPVSTFDSPPEILPYACTLFFDLLKNVTRTDLWKKPTTYETYLPCLIVITSLLWAVVESGSEETLEYIQKYFDWSSICTVLNALLNEDLDIDLTKETFPMYEEKLKQRPNGNAPAPEDQIRPLWEDYLLRGLPHTVWYFPNDWFEGSLEEEERQVEKKSMNLMRKQRLVWIGHRIAAQKKGIIFATNSFQPISKDFPPTSQPITKVDTTQETTTAAAPTIPDPSAQSDVTMIDSPPSRTTTFSSTATATTNLFSRSSTITAPSVTPATTFPTTEYAPAEGERDRDREGEGDETPMANADACPDPGPDPGPDPSTPEPPPIADDSDDGDDEGDGGNDGDNDGDNDAPMMDISPSREMAPAQTQMQAQQHTNLLDEGADPGVFGPTEEWPGQAEEGPPAYVQALGDAGDTKDEIVGWRGNDEKSAMEVEKAVRKGVTED